MIFNLLLASSPLFAGHTGLLPVLLFAAAPFKGRRTELKAPTELIFSKITGGELNWSSR
jgi:hypothetical protein